MTEPLAKHEAQILLDLVRRCIFILSSASKLADRRIDYETLLFYEKRLALATTQAFEDLDRGDLFVLLAIVNGALEEKMLNLSPWHDSVYEDLVSIRRKLRELIGMRP